MGIRRQLQIRSRPHALLTFFFFLNPEKVTHVASLLFYTSTVKTCSTWTSWTRWGSFAAITSRPRHPVPAGVAAAIERLPAGGRAGSACRSSPWSPWWSSPCSPWRYTTLCPHSICGLASVRTTATTKARPPAAAAAAASPRAKTPCRRCNTSLTWAHLLT